MKIDRTKCLVCGKRTKLFCFPKDVPRLMLWLTNLGQEKLLEKCTPKYIANNAKICVDHFEERHFTSTLRDRLSKQVVPLPVVSSTESDAKLSGEIVNAELEFEVSSDENESEEESVVIPPPSDASDKILNSFGSEDIFGKFVASELRALRNNPLLYLQTKQSILESITRANFELLRS